MVVAYRTQRLFNFGRSIHLPKSVQLANGKRSIFFGSSSHKPRLIGERYKNGGNLRLCGCRGYHPKETRPTLAKLTPQELKFSSGFYKPDCEYAGLSCLDCYSQKQCINFWGLTHWTTVVCGSSLTGEANIYCDPSTDKCTSIKPEGCTAISRYDCLRDGLLPNTKDCTLYHKCSNMSAEDFLCETNYVYNQEYGKCVLKLSDGDCITIPTCGLKDYVNLYPKDFSIYYGCSKSKFFIKSCLESEIYNLNSKICESRCASLDNIPNTRNCGMYYQCVTSGIKLEAKEVLCPEGQGYNPSTKKCDSSYTTLCNELHLLENDIYDLITFTPIIEAVIQPIRTMLNYLHISPVRIVFIFGLDDQTLSDGILIIDYIIKNKQIPPATLGIIVDTILPYLPSSIQNIFEALMKVGIINVRSAIRSMDNQHISNLNVSDDVRSYLISILSDVRIDIPQIINSLEGKEQQETSKIIFHEMIHTFKIPESQKPHLAEMLQTKLDVIADSLNEKLGVDLLMAKENMLKLNQLAFDQLIYKFMDDIPSKLYPHNQFFAGILRMIIRNRYRANYGAVKNFVDNFYFTTSNLI